MNRNGTETVSKLMFFSFDVEITLYLITHSKNIQIIFLPEKNEQKYIDTYFS